MERAYTFTTFTIDTCLYDSIVRVSNVPHIIVYVWCGTSCTEIIPVVKRHTCFNKLKSVVDVLVSGLRYVSLYGKVYVSHAYSTKYSITTSLAASD